MRVSKMDDIHARVPVDRVAARVTGPGERYTPDKKVLTRDSDLPIATREATTAERGTATFADLTGRRFGRFIVIGLARDFRRQWVVRCSCGRYSTRTARAVKNPENKEDKCEFCRHLAFLKREDRYRRTGRDVGIADV